MPKHDFLTPKAIANRIKSKGLQKLKWYCQMCQKQCRDENGFKCHITSESHQRQLLLVAENPGRVIGEFSKEFLTDFMHLLRTSYGTRRVLANEVYQQYIKDKNHYHMNATRWETLTGFVMFMGREGMCDVDCTERGWFVKYIDRRPETLAKQASASKKKKMDKDDEEKIQKAIEDQITRALSSKKGEEEEKEPAYTELCRQNEEEKIILNFKINSGVTPPTPISTLSSLDASKTTSVGSVIEQQCDPSCGPEEGREMRGNDEAGASEKVVCRGVAGGEQHGGGGGFMRPQAPSGRMQAGTNVLRGVGGGGLKKREKKSSQESESGKRKLSVLEEIREMEETKRIKLNRKDYWIAEGIIVKVMHKKLGDKFYKKKGKVLVCRDRYTAIVEMLESRDKIKIDQAHLETVLPAMGNLVLVVNGGYSGLRATLEAIDLDTYSASVKIAQGPTRGRVVKGLPYEDISKLALQ